MSDSRVISSYTSANTQPVKLYRDLGLLHSISVGKVLPRHVNLCPTNRCDLHCPWCSCSERTIRDELPLDEMLDLVDVMEELGTKGVTITGGGEPVLHDGINDLFDALALAQIKIGLVSNGIQIRRLKPASVRAISWCRVSFSDTRDWSRTFEKSLEYLEGEGCKGLSMSYVLTNEVNTENLVQVVRRAVEHNYTHVRVVDDILHPSPRSMERARAALQQSGVPLDRVIFQPRSEYTRGMKQCRLSLLKPMVAPDGFIYPCCGCQYSLPDEQSTFPVRMRMGRMAELRAIINEQRMFDGSVCERCFYSGYLTALADLATPVDHLEFV